MRKTQPPPVFSPFSAPGSGPKDAHGGVQMKAFEWTMKKVAAVPKVRPPFFSVAQAKAHIATSRPTPIHTPRPYASPAEPRQTLRIGPAPALTEESTIQRAESVSGSGHMGANGSVQMKAGAWIMKKAVVVPKVFTPFSSVAQLKVQITSSRPTHIHTPRPYASPAIPRQALPIGPGPALTRKSVVQRSEDPGQRDWSYLRQGGSSYGEKIALVSDASDQYRTKQANVFANEEHVRPPRSFDGERRQQVLRWLATYLLNKYGGVEIQCYEENDTIYVSSNKDDVNQAMTQALNSSSLLPAFEQKNSSIPLERRARHAWKWSRIAPTKNDDEVRIKKIVSSAKLMIIPPDNKLVAGYHTERRIRAYLGRPLTQGRLAGTRRACMVCATALNLDNHAHPGILYTSKAGLGGLETWEVQDVAEQRRLASYITKNRSGDLTDVYGSDSEDDLY